MLQGVRDGREGWRRSRPTGFAFGPNGHEEIDPKTIKVGIVGNPEIERMRWLEEERLRPPHCNPPVACLCSST